MRISQVKDQCCFRLISFNLYQRYEMSQVAESKADDMQQKLADRPKDPVTIPKRATDLDPIPSQHCEGLDSRAKVEQRVLELLKDDQVNAVALCGMGGAGKTTTAKNIKNKEAKDLFDAILMVEISQDVNIGRIQDHIAASINLCFDGKKSLEQRATKLYNALKEVKPKRRENDHQTKILLIMDNIWENLNLELVGIPHQKTPELFCKILYTSREIRVCKSMGVHDKNIVDVSMLGPHESRSLFWEHITNVGRNKVDKSLEDRLLRSCGGLPLAIVTLAKSLCGEDVSFWRHLADELEKPISCRNEAEVHDGTYKIIEASYKFIRNKEKKMCLLLACLYPSGLSIPIEDLLRYGIGLDLFRRANSLIDVIWEANRWADQLVSSSLLLDDDDVDDDDDDPQRSTRDGRKVKIHDVVRSCAILCAEKDGHKLIVGAVSHWESDESLKNCTAISLTNDSDISRLKGMQFDMLEILLLSPTPGLKLDDVFKGMGKLKILVLPGLGSGLPKSIHNLSHLRTLHLEDCDLQDEDIECICELVRLLVLSLRRSKFERLPHRMKNLSNLRLLDLRDCTSLTTIPANVLSSLTQLEGLYMLNSYASRWPDINSEVEQGGTASIAELMLLCRLKVLEIQITRFQQITSDMVESIITNKHKSILYANKYYGTSTWEDEKTIKFSSVDFEVEIGYSLEWLWRYPFLKTLLPKSTCIEILSCSDDGPITNLVPDLDNEGFQILEVLELRELGVTMISDGIVPPQMFCNLRHLHLDDLKNLETYVLPIDVAPNLTTLCVGNCPKLKYIWMENVAPSTQKEVHKLPLLKVLILETLPNLLHAVGSDDNLKNSTSAQTLFNTNKIIFPSLEELQIYDISMPEKLLEGDIHPKQEINAAIANPQLSPFLNLRKLFIIHCNNVKIGIGLPSIDATLVHLETLQIIECFKMKEVISEETEDDIEISSKILTFPKLHLLQLTGLHQLECMYGGSYKVCFPTLKEMTLRWNRCMTRFVGPINTAEFLHEKVEFPSLEVLRLDSTPIIATPSISFYSVFPNLRILCLDGLEWKHAFSKDMVATIGLTQLIHLEKLRIWSCYNMEGVVEEIDEGAITPSSSFNLEFPRLTSIELFVCYKMRWFFSTRHQHIVLHFPSLQRVYIWECKNMELFSNVTIKAPKLVDVKVERYDYYT